MPVTAKTQPNSYLDDPRREIYVDQDLTLTKINPALMTRQISEIVTDNEGVRFHITSLNPIRPANRPTALEAEALRGFEQSDAEFSQTLVSGNVRDFFFMAPLVTEVSCLQCHASQGYVEGDIRGGISVIQPLPSDTQAATIIALFSTVGAIGLAGILYFGNRIRRAHKIIAEHAVVDGLTGISNRRALTAYLKREFDRSRRELTPLSVIMCDVDFFKAYNDAFGHQAGDACLKSIAEILADEIHRGTDFCARYGGEEFVIVLPNTDAGGAYAKAEACRARIETLKIIGGDEGTVVTISCGVATATGSGDYIKSEEALLSMADKALYSAKTEGRNRVEAQRPRDNH